MYCGCHRALSNCSMDNPENMADASFQGPRDNEKQLSLFSSAGTLVLCRPTLKASGPHQKLLQGDDIDNVKLSPGRMLIEKPCRSAALAPAAPASMARFRSRSRPRQGS